MGGIVKNRWFIAGLVSALLTGLGYAETIAPEDFDNRAVVRFPDYAGTTTLTNFPALLTLTDGESVIAAEDFESDDYSDLRFTTDDASNTVPFEIEQWFFPPAVSAVPTSLSGCVLWLKADDGVQTDPVSGLVTNWIDRSGNANDASQGNVVRQPTNVLAQLNGNPVVRFNGGGAGNTVTNRLEFPSVSAQTVLIVNRVETGSQNLDGILGVPNDNGIRRQNASGWQYGSWVNAGSEFYVNGRETTAMGEDEYHLISVVRNGASTASHLGHYFDHAETGRSFDGEIAEVIIYNRALTPVELNNVHAYIEDKYALDIDHVGGTAVVWVQVPELTAATELYAYWGNTNATTIPSYATDGSIWDSEYVGVWHLGSTNEVEDLRDSTANMFDGTNAVSPHDTANEAAIIGDGQRFDWNGSNFDYISLPDNAHDFSDVFSVSLWANFGIFNGRKNIIGKDQDTSRFAFTMHASTDRRLNFASKNGGQSGVLSANPVFNANQWHHIAATVQTGSLVRLYVDGVDVGGGTVGNRNNFGSLRLGRTPDTYWGGIEGLMDEARISTSVRSPDWIKASYDSQASPGGFARLEQDAYWDTDTAGGVQGGSGDWNTTTSYWSEDTGGSSPLQNWRDGSVAHFVPSSASTISADAVAAQGIVVEGAGYAFTDGTISVGGSGITANEDVDISSAIALTSDQVWQVATNKTLTVSGGIANNGNRLVIDGEGSVVNGGNINGGGVMTKNGDGKITMSARCSYSGGTVVNDGELHCTVGCWYENRGIGSGLLTINSGGFARFSGAHALGRSATGKPVTINGGTLQLDNNNYVTAINITGGKLQGAGTIRSKGTITANASDTTSLISTPWQFYGNRTFTVANGSASPDLRLSGNISQSGTRSMTKNGAGAMEVTGAGVYSGGTTVSAGALLVNNGSGSGLGTGAVTVNGGTLGGTGSVGAAVSVSDGGIIAPGESAGNLTISTGDVAFVTSGATNSFAVELNSASAYDSLTIEAGSVTLSNVALDVSLGYAPSQLEKYFIIVNDGSDPVVGSFEGLPSDGSVMSLGTYDGSEYEGLISYSGDSGSQSIGGGNDVVIFFHPVGLLMIVR